MSVFASRPTLRWVLPAAALAGVIVAGSAGRMLVQDTSNALPERSPQQLLMDVAQAKVSSLSGTIVQKSDLGLPSLPQLSGTDLNTLVNGNHTVRFWYDGDKRVRVSAQNPDSSESDLVRNGTDLWTYSSAGKTATHTTLPASTGATPGVPSGGMPSVVPSAGASELSGGITQFLGTLAPTTKISTDGTAKVAGRQAYELVIQPKDTGTRIAQIRIAIDGTKHIPLQFQVYARGSNDPAFSAGFTSISFSKPDAAEFTFNPPAGTKVTQAKPDQDKNAAPQQPSTGKSSDTRVVGKGWTSVVVAKNVPTSAPAGKTAEQKQAAAATDKFLKSLPKVHGAWGSGRLLHTKLFSALLTDDGRLIAGAVDPSRLYQVAEQTR